MRGECVCSHESKHEAVRGFASTEMCACPAFTRLPARPNSCVTLTGEVFRSATPPRVDIRLFSQPGNKHFVGSDSGTSFFVVALHSLGVKAVFPHRDEARNNLPRGGSSINRNQPRTPVIGWQLRCGAAAAAFNQNRWTAAESRLQLPKYARKWSALARRPLHPLRDKVVVMYNTSEIELTFNKREDISEVINGTLQLNVLVTSSPTAMWNESCGEQLQDFGHPQKILIGVMLAIITAVTVMGNTLVVIAVCVVKKLRQPSNYLLVSLAVADLSVAIVVMPFVIVTDLTGGEWLFGEVFCNIFIAMDVMCCTASIMTLCVISVDRYLGITRPLTYPARQNGQLMAKMILGVWLVSASITLPPFCGWAKNVHTAGVCLISQDFGYTIYSTAVAFYIPMLVMLVMYYKIFKAARKSGAKHRFTDLLRRERLETVSNEALRMQGLKPPGVAEECAALSRLLNRERRNISIFKREQKAATTLGVIVGVFSVCWLPFFILSTARPFICGVECSCVPIWLERTLLWLGYANSLMNPFIYAFFNRDLRSTYRDLLRCRYRNINRRLSAVGVHEALKV
ncbi:5-hydroxytryptamine receptor 7 isoform 1-T1 [Spinachia spinachia]